ncbi:phosphoadenosine phosphosulfate reductase family protein [Brevibacillus sp. NPDC003359]|uniref:phosphoadenosine phosphosulfate reductase domain-containing protein n=1 Tax=unclassified Brevibacillus TaxID=2684853 RepID=UPI0036B77B33
MFFNINVPPYGARANIAWPELLPSQLIKQRKRKQKVDVTDITHQVPIELPDNVSNNVMEVVDSAIERIFKQNELVVVAYSGGKDSSMCVQKCIEFVLKNPEFSSKLVISSANTGVENPLIQQHIQKVKNAVESLKETHGLEIPFHIVEPDVEDNYITCVLGKGYKPPDSLFKYCVDKFKITPSKKAFEDYVQQHGNLCLVLGVRNVESKARKLSIERHFDNEFYGSHPVKGVVTAAPIIHLSSEEVVTYLIRNHPVWNEIYSNHNLINLYGSAAGTMECPIGASITNANDAITSCTSGAGARFGCWSCTVVRQDTSLINLSLDYPEMLPYLEMRGYLKAILDIRYCGFTGYQRNPNTPYIMGSGIGDLTIDIRTILLEEFLKLGIPIKEKELLVILKEVRKRESLEGFVLTQRFFKALFALFPYQTHTTGQMCSPIFDPDGTGVDRCTQEDIEYFKKLEREEKQRKEKALEILETLNDGILLQINVKDQLIIQGTFKCISEEHVLMHEPEIIDIAKSFNQDPDPLLYKEIALKNVYEIEIQETPSLIKINDNDQYSFTFEN